MKAVLDPTRFVRPELRALRAYSLDSRPYRHKLDQNEVPWDLPRRVKTQVTEALLQEDWSRYPDFHADALRQALGRLHGWPWEGILVGNGSNELLGLALEALAGPGQEILGSEPSFGLYRMFVLRAGAVPRFLPPRPDLRLPLDELGKEIRRDPTRPLLLCAPNNPTGEAPAPEALEHLLESLEAPLLLDNAYAEFCRHDYRPLLARHRHLVIFRTFSKAWSLAGLRLGYLLADPALVGELVKAKLPYNVNRASVLAGLAALGAREEIHRRLEILRRRRSQWAGMLAEFGLEVFPSEANFLLVRCVSPDGPVGSWSPEEAQSRARWLWEGLAARGILVRDVSTYPGLQGCLRISVGRGAALRALRRALKELLEGAS